MATTAPEISSQSASAVDRCPGPPQLPVTDRNQLIAYFQDAWELYEWLFSAAADERFFFQQPDPLRHPLIFYFGHTAAFYINKFRMAGLLDDGVHARFDQLFAEGVDPECAEELEQRIDWPSVNEVRVYRDVVHDVVMNVLRLKSLNGPITDEHPWWAVLMAIEHDRLHFETSSVLIRQCPLELLETPCGWNYAPSRDDRNVRSAEFVDIDGGSVKLGKPQDDSIFGWDNEFGLLTVTVAPFRISRTLVTNQQYLAFVSDGGYFDARHWSSAGRQWKDAAAVRCPRFWELGEGEFVYRAMFDTMSMPLDWPVEVNRFEAEAFCRWSGDAFRLPTEAEFRQAMPVLDGVGGQYDCDHNVNLRYGSPCPVNHLPTAGVGNVWQWIQDPFYRLPGFRPHRLYLDFSTAFFGSKHGMLLGGSWATTGAATSRYYRLWFRPCFMQHAGFRMVEGTPGGTAE